MANIETIRIKGGKGEPETLIINLEDFDESIHEKAEEPVEAPAQSSDVGDDETTDEKTSNEAPSEAKLLKMRKGDLVAIAEEAGLEIVPDEETIATLAKKIVEAQEAKSDG